MEYVPLIGLILLIVIGVCWRSWLQHRRYATWGIVFFRSRDRAQIFRELFLFLFFAVVMREAVEFAVWPAGVLNRMLVSPRNVLGSVALFVGLALMIQAQLHLGASWRIGIDEQSKPGLVVRGLYTVSRNPIFLGLLTAALGFTLLIPTLLSLAVLLGSVIAVRWQVLDEESYLRRAYDGEYLAYASRVGRFLPWLGRLR